MSDAAFNSSGTNVLAPFPTHEEKQRAADFDGYTAFVNGRPITANPYLCGTSAENADLGSRWRQAWLAACREKMAINALRNGPCNTRLCNNDAVGFDSDGKALCEDCLIEANWMDVVE